MELPVPKELTQFLDAAAAHLMQYLAKEGLKSEYNSALMLGA